LTAPPGTIAWCVSVLLNSPSLIPFMN
jgi:hypothetical protein